MNYIETLGCSLLKLDNVNNHSIKPKDTWVRMTVVERSVFISGLAVTIVEDK